jgi:hypothetical protein
MAQRLYIIPAGSNFFSPAFELDPDSSRIHRFFMTIPGYRFNHRLSNVPSKTPIPLYEHGVHPLSGCCQGSRKSSGATADNQYIRLSQDGKHSRWFFDLFHILPFDL